MKQTSSQTVFVLVTAACCLGSPSSVPRSEGLKFVLALPTPLLHEENDFDNTGRARLAIGTKHEKNIIFYVITCVRHCLKDDYLKGVTTRPITRQLNYPAVNLEILSYRAPNVTSGLNLTVFTVEANFIVFVIMFYPVLTQDSSLKMDTSLLYPITLDFDEFYVATFGIMSYIIIIGHEFACTSVEIKLASTMQDSTPVLECEDPRLTSQHRCGDPRGQSDVHSINSNCSSYFELLKFESLFIDSPENGNLSFRDITGTYIKSSHPVTVLAGSKDGILDQNLNFYSVTPVDAHGVFSIIPPNYLIDQDQIVKMVTSNANNTIFIQTNTSMTDIVLEHPSDWSEITTDKSNCIAIFSVFTVIIFHIMLSKDTGSCMMPVIPEQLWAQNYIWLDMSIASEHNQDLIHYIMIVARSEYIVDLKLDENTIPAAEWHSMVTFLSNNTYSFVARHFGSSKSQHEVYHPQPRVRFYLIIQAMALQADISCTSPAQFFLSKNCSKSPMVKGDFLDNDCDQRIDEEEEDGVDNDADGLIDEDVSAPFKVDGFWGKWTEEVCVVECGSTSGWNQRERECNNPAPQGGGEQCEGGSVEFRDKCTSSLVECTQYCPRKTWGFNCSQKCPHCTSDCNKHSGECESCNIGMTGIYCNITCPSNCAVCNTNKKCLDCIFGYDISTNCSTKCPDLTYGSMCLNCSAKCRDRECAKDNGACENCESPHTYGRFCDLECSDNCSSHHCDRENGACGHCIDGLWGSECNRVCIELCEDASCSRVSGKCILKQPEEPFDFEETLRLALQVLITIVSAILILRCIKRCKALYSKLKNLDCCKPSFKKEEQAVEEEIKENPEEKYYSELLKRKNEVKMQFLKQKGMLKAHKY